MLAPRKNHGILLAAEQADRENSSFAVYAHARIYTA